MHNQMNIFEIQCKKKNNVLLQAKSISFWSFKINFDAERFREF